MISKGAMLEPLRQMHQIEFISNLLASRASHKRSRSGRIYAFLVMCAEDGHL